MRVLLFVALCVAVFLVLRRLSRPQEYTAEHLARVLPPTAPRGGKYPHTQEAARLQIVRYYFREIDAANGPPNPEAFYDELFVDVVDPRTRDIWNYSYFVATPQGVAQVMQEEKWDWLFSADLLIVKTYELNTILDAVLESLEEQHELPRAVARKQAAKKGREYIG
jgi:hypothetical protein